MADMLSEAIGNKLPNISMGGMATIVGWLLGAVLFTGILATVFYFVYKSLIYNKVIKIYRKVGNKTILVAVDKGYFARVGNAGDYWCLTKKLKKTLPRPTIQSGKNEYWFFEREDGEFINFGLGDIDAQMKAAKVYYIDEDMRLARLGIQKNLRDRFQKVSFWQKYGGLIMNLIYLIVSTILLVVLFKEIKGVWEAGHSMAGAVRDMAVQVENMARRVGGGMQTVPVLLPFIALKGRLKKWLAK